MSDDIAARVLLRLSGALLARVDAFASAEKGSRNAALLELLARGLGDQPLALPGSVQARKAEEVAARDIKPTRGRPSKRKTRDITGSAPGRDIAPKPRAFVGFDAVTGEPLYRGG